MDQTLDMVDLYPLPWPTCLPPLCPTGPTPFWASMYKTGLPEVLCPRGEKGGTCWAAGIPWALPSLGQLRVIAAPLSEQGERVWAGCTMSSCMWLSSTGTFRLLFICLLMHWKRLRMAILMVPSSRVLWVAMFWMWAQRDS